MNEDAAPKSKNEPVPLNTSFEVMLKMRSDWHVGSGAGRPGAIDRLVRRDAEELPYVPAKTLTGIWRDACERVVLGLDDGEKTGVWNQWVAYLFGDQPAIEDAERSDAGQGDQSDEHLDKDWRAPRRAALSVRSAHLPADLRRALANKPVAREAITFVKPGVSIHPRTGRARTDFLRFEEMARGGVSLTAACELRGDLSESERLIASALLVAGARLVERLGGKRRRGAGRCELTVAGGEDIGLWLNWIEAHPKPQPPKPLDHEDRLKSLHANAAAASGDWLRLRLTLTTKLPVIVPSGTIGNLIKTLDYIPGTYLLPHVTKNLKGVNAQAAIARGDLIVTNATIEIEDERGRPVPFSLAHRKTEGGLKDGRGVFNQLCEPGPEKNHRDGYVSSTANVRPSNQGGRLPFFDTLDPQVETHNVVEDEVQRPTERVGGVYSYQAIPPDVTLRADLRLRHSLNASLSAADQKWFKKLEGQLNIGRASKDDYGAVELCVVGEPEPTPNEMSVNGELTVWLLSDLLLRDERLRPTASLDHLGKALQHFLNERLEPPHRIEITLRKDPAFPRQRRTDSWHVGWGLPRPSLAGLQAGTCAVFEVTGQINQSRLTRLLDEIEASGLGERRAEGYGQLCFNDPLLTSKLEGLTGGQPLKEEKTEARFLIPKQSAVEYAQLIEHEAARGEMRRAALGFAANRDDRKKALGIEITGKQSKPRMSQLGALRSTLSRLLSAADSRRVLDWLAHLGATRNRREDWPPGSLKLMDDLITKNERVWELLKIDFTEIALTENGAEELKQTLWAEAVRTLVNACIQAHKRDLEPEQEGE